ncbi:MAG: Crp/Fnr family transcriptional regulator [Longimicrobiales bacterium]|jgi:CRP/FNR family transcriptional regulator, cyclic AMP receptor protein
MPFRLNPPRDRKLYRLVKRSESVELVKGRTLYAPGDEARWIYLVREGFMRLVLPGMERGQRERTVSVALPWETFGDEALTEGHRRYGAIAGSTCTVSLLSNTAVLQGLKTAKSSLAAYLEGQERELHRLRHAQGGSHGPNAAQRLAEVLIELGARCGEPSGRAVRFSERLTHQVLADLAGAHRATVTTLLNDWLYDGVLEFTDNNRLTLARPSDLWVLAGYQSPD